LHTKPLPVIRVYVSPRGVFKLDSPSTHEAGVASHSETIYDFCQRAMPVVKMLDAAIRNWRGTEK
jgi:hypothetical protein